MAVAKEISVDSAIAAVLSELEAFSHKIEYITALNAFLGGQHCLHFDLLWLLC